MDDYDKVLQDELTDAHRRLRNCDAPEGRREIKRHIKEVEQDIRQRSRPPSITHQPSQLTSQHERR